MRVRSFRLNIWDVGGQKMLRTYWRNYYEQTDAMLWVVDSVDVERMQVPAVEGPLLRLFTTPRSGWKVGSAAQALRTKLDSRSHVHYMHL